MKVVENKSFVEFLPEILGKRWSYLIHCLRKTVENHQKEVLIQNLVEEREKFANNLDLSQIALFTGIDTVINRILKWKWNEGEGRDLDKHIKVIAKIGEELMVIYNIEDSIRNEILKLTNEELVETEIGKKHFDAIDIYHSYIIKSKTEKAKLKMVENRKKRSSRPQNSNFKLPCYELSISNTIMMLIKAMNPFYNARKLLTSKQQSQLVTFYHRFIEKHGEKKTVSTSFANGKKSELANILEILSGSPGNKPTYMLGTMKLNEKESMMDFWIGWKSLHKFVTFLNSFNKKYVSDKAKLAETLVQEIIIENQNFSIESTNQNIIKRDGDIFSEIDIIAKSELKINGEIMWLNIEVKDYAYWKGWISGQNIKTREKYYQKAAAKIPKKEAHIKKQYHCSQIKSYIVTSIPEVFDAIKGVKLVYVENLYNELESLINSKINNRSNTTRDNVFIKYYKRLKDDYTKISPIEEKILIEKKEIKKRKATQEELKNKQEIRFTTKERIEGHIRILKQGLKMDNRKLRKDTGENHYLLQKNVDKKKLELHSKNKEVRRINRLEIALKEEITILDNEIERSSRKIEKFNSKIENRLKTRSIL